MHKSLNILMVSDDFLPAATGVGVHLQIVCQELLQKGHKVTLFTARQTGQQPSEDWKGIRTIRFPSINIAGFWQATPLPHHIRSALRDAKFDIIHFHYWGYMALLVHHITKTHSDSKRMSTYHMTADHLTQPWFMRPWRGIFERTIIQFCNKMDLVIAPCKKLVKQIQGLGIKVPIVALSNPLARDLYYQSSQSVSQTTKPQDSAISILYAGRLNPEKNIPLLLEAFKIHLQHHPQSILWLAGKGDQETLLKKRCKELEIDSQTIFLGFLPHAELAKYYQDCDVFVLPSVVETQGMVVMEAMRFSKPVIVTKEIISADDLVDDGSNGYIVDAKDPMDLGSKLSMLATSSDLRKIMGDASYKKSVDYNPELVTAYLLEHYQRALVT